MSKERYDTAKRQTFWRCACACGAETVVSRPNLMSGYAQACSHTRHPPGSYAREPERQPRKRKLMPTTAETTTLRIIRPSLNGDHVSDVEVPMTVKSIETVVRAGKLEEIAFLSRAGRHYLERFGEPAAVTSLLARIGVLAREIAA